MNKDSGVTERIHPICDYLADTLCNRKIKIPTCFFYGCCFKPFVLFW